MNTKGGIVVILLILIPLASAKCFSLIPSINPDSDCAVTSCSSTNPLTIEMYDQGSCILTQTTNCNCQGSTPAFSSCSYTQTIEVYNSGILSSSQTQDITQPTCSINCGECGKFNQQTQKCESDDPSEDNNCFVCECNSLLSPQCLKLIDLNGNLGACSYCDSSGNIVFDYKQSCFLSSGSLGVCDSGGNCVASLTIPKTAKAVTPKCSDGIDNDGDGSVDWQYDSGCCGNPSKTSENNYVCKNSDGSTYPGDPIPGGGYGDQGQCYDACAVSSSIKRCSSGWLQSCKNGCWTNEIKCADYDAFCSEHSDPAQCIKNTKINQPTYTPTTTPTKCDECSPLGKAEQVDRNSYKVCSDWGRTDSQGNKIYCWSEIDCLCTNENKGQVGRDSNSQFTCVYDPACGCGTCTYYDEASRECIASTSRDGFQDQCPKDQVCWGGKCSPSEQYDNYRKARCNEQPSNENSDSDSSSNEDSNGKFCFVATAVYGDINAPQLDKLRSIRDNILVKDSFGKELVSFYYSGAGKETAEFIQEKIPFTIPLIRKGLDYVIEKQEVKNE